MKAQTAKTKMPKGQDPEYHFRAYNSGRHLSHKFHKKKINKVASLISTGKSVLDAGCGSSALSYVLSNKGCKVTGVDVKKQYVDFISKRVKGDFYCADLRKMRLGKKFDVVTCLDVIEHFTPQDREKVLETLDRHVKPGGTLILAFPTGFYLRYVEGAWHLLRDSVYGKQDYDDFGTHEIVSPEIIEKFFAGRSYSLKEKSILGMLDRFFVFEKRPMGKNNHATS